MDQEYIDELKQLLTLAKHPRTLSLLENAVAKASQDSPQLNGQSETKPAELSDKMDGWKPTMRQKDSSISMVKISNYGWDQSEKFVKIYISDLSGINTIKAENIRSEFNQSYIKVELLDVNGKNYGLMINNLYSAILPDECTVKVKSGMVIVSLRKTRKQEWQFLTAREKRLKDSKERKPPKMDDKEDPSQSLMNLMKQMYDDGDDEMKRTIAKSWYESQEKRKNESMDI